MNNCLVFVCLTLSLYLFITTIQGRIIDRFDLAQELHTNGFLNISLWICIINQVNVEFDTSLRFTDSPSDDGGFGYGLFQFYDPYWCVPGLNGGGGCQIDCNKFLDDDITDDLACVKTVIEKQGIEAWEEGKRDCEKSSKDLDVPDWVWSKVENLDAEKLCPPHRTP